MTLCYLGLGSNLGSPERQLKQAIASIYKFPRCSVIKESSVYFSRPLGIRFQPTYCNRVIAIQTSLSPIQLLRHCQALEKKHLRVRRRHWGARTLDIDILLFGDKSLHTLELSIPHPQMLIRDFVLVPLLEISPLIKLPNGQPIFPYLSGVRAYLA